MNDAFAQLLVSLADTTLDLSPEQVAELSDPDSARLEAIKASWPSLPDERRIALMRLLRQLADDQIELIFESINRFALTDARPEVRRLAIENLWECEDPALVQPLLKALAGDSADEVRGAAGVALGRFVYLGEVETLSSALLAQIEDGLLAAAREDIAEEVRLRSLEALGFSSRLEVRELIRKAYLSPDERSQLGALRAIEHSADELWIEEVLAKLHHGSPEIRLQAVQAAGELGSQRAAADLIELLEDVDERVRRASIWSLGQVGGVDANNALEGLLAAARDPADLEFIESALENLAFLEGTRDLLLIDFDDGEDLAD